MFSKAPGPTFPLQELPQALRTLLQSMKISLVESTEIDQLESNKDAPVKQPDSLLDGVVMNVEIRAKKKHSDNA